MELFVPVLRTGLRPSCSVYTRIGIFSPPLSLLFLLFFTLPAFAQEQLVVEKTDLSGWPLISTTFYLLDNSGRPLPDVAKEKMRVEENGVGREIISFSCPGGDPSGEISALLTVDISGSMASVGRGGRIPNIELARAAADAWIDALPDGSFECGITSFDDHAFVLADLTTDRRLLRSAAEGLKPSGGTNYDAAILSSPAGALPLLAKAKHRPVLIFLTDGLSKSDPEPIIARAKEIGAVIFCVTLGMRAPDVLKQISEKTGGAWFENVTTVEEARAIYRALLYRARGGEPCRMTWRSGPDCDPEREVLLSWTSPELVNRSAYTAPEQSIPRLSITPPVLFFDSTMSEASVTFTAPGAPVTIERIEHLPGRNEFVLDLPPLPLTLGAGESRTLSVRSGSRSADNAVDQWRVQSSCYATTLVVRRSGVKGETIPIHLVAPNGGEVFNAGERGLITWDGVPPETPVRLEYSINAGRTWTTIAEGVTGGIYPWHVPGTPSDECLARVTVIGGENEATRIAHLPVEKHFWSMDPTGEFIVGYMGDTSIMIGGTRTPAGTFGLWSARTGAFVRSRHVTGDPLVSYKDPTPRSVEYDPTGRFILCGNYMLDANTGKVLWWVSGGEANVHGYMTEDAITSSFSPNGNQVLLKITKDGGEVLGVLDSKSGRVLTTIGDPRRSVFTAQFSPDGKTILTAARDGVSLWDAGTGTKREMLTERPAYSAVFSRSGTYVAAVPDDADTMLLWDLEAHDLDASPVLIGKNTSGYKGARFAPDESGVIVWRDGRPGIADYRTGEVRTEYGDKSSSRSALRLAYSPDGTLAATVEPYGSAREISVRDAASGAILSTARDTGSMVGISMAFSPDGSRLAWSYGYGVKIAELGASSGSDKSDDLWTILGKADPRFVDVDFGNRNVGSMTDSVVTGFLENRGDAPLRVEAIDIVEGEAGSFTLVSPLPPFDVPPGTTYSVEFRFAPTSVGEKASVALMRTDVGQLSARLTGKALGATLKPAAEEIDFGEREVGSRNDSTIGSFLRSVGTLPVTIISAELRGPNGERFSLNESLGGRTIAAGESISLSLGFLPDTLGLFSVPLVLTLADGQEVTVAVHGRGGGFGADRYPDPTTFRTVAVPNAVIPPEGTLVLGSYDLLGLMGGYAVTDNIMILAGGAPPLPDDWGGTSGDAFGAYSIGLKGNLRLSGKLLVAAGFQWGASFFEEESTPEDDSRIIAPTLYGALSYGDDDRRISLTGGYAFKRHTTLVDPAAGLIDEFPKEAPIIALGGDWRIGDRWKLAAEGIYMKTVGTAPIITTARWFGRTWALDFGAAWLLIDTGEDEPSSIPVMPVVSFIWTHGLR